jgi:polysaccharide deacetylase 2 family uncharacterized protein YibQ
MLRQVMIKTRHLALTLLLCFITASISQARPLLEHIPPSDPRPPKIIIIIDDIGDNRPLGQRAVELPGRVTLAFLPHTPNAPALAEMANALGKEIMLHMPMSNLSKRALGPGGLTPELDKTTFTTTLRQAMASVPHLSGLNNHMGSELTQLPKQMNWLMEELRCHDLFFVDSRTSAQSVAYESAEHAGITHLQRDVFLDHERNSRKIAAAFEKLTAIAKQTGLAIGIGHPYPETLQFLEAALPKLDQMGIELIFPSQATTHEALLAQQRRESLSYKQATLGY